MDDGEFHAGDLVSCDWDDDGSFRVAKVLAIEDEGIHLRVYAERFAARPRSRPAELTLGTIDDDSFGLGHMPLNWAEFALWRPERVGREAVHQEELDGYEMWREARRTRPPDRPRLSPAVAVASDRETCTKL